MEQLRKYLNGELDARAMHKLEREAHNDPFLWDVMKGMEGSDEDHQANLDAIDKLINEQVEKDRKRIIPMWKVASVAASLLVGLSIGGWLLMHQTAKEPITLNTVKTTEPTSKEQAETSPVITQPVLRVTQQPVIAQLNRNKAKMPITALPLATLASAQPVAFAGVTLKTDTIEYNTRAYPVKADSKINAILKKLPGIDVDSSGNVTSQGQPITKVRINGTDLFGSNVTLATQNLPASIIDKIQVINDFSNMAARTSIKSGEPNKVLNLVVRNNSDKKVSASTDELFKKLAKLEVDSNNIIRPQGQLLSKNRAYDKNYSQTLIGKVAGVQVTTPDNKSRNLTEQVTGRVVDRDSRAGLPGASVNVAGSNVVSQTDVNGNFSIALPAGKDVLNIGYIGYNNQHVKAKTRDSLNVSLSPNSASLNEVMVTGYGTVKAVKEVKIESAHPIIGWKAYNKYLTENAIMVDGSTGTIELSFTIGTNGAISNINIINGLSADMNQKAIKLIQNGPVWTSESNGKPKIVTQKIQFHK